MRRALAIDEHNFGNNHSSVARDLTNLAQLLQATDRLAEAGPLMRRSLAIDEGNSGSSHPQVAFRLNNIATLMCTTNRLAEAEPLMRRALEIDEASYGPEHPDVARDLNNLAQLLQATTRLSEDELPSRKHLLIFLSMLRQGFQHPNLHAAIGNYAALLKEMGNSEEDIQTKLNALVTDSTGEIL
jgi:hypothetical protein